MTRQYVQPNTGVIKAAQNLWPCVQKSHLLKIVQAHILRQNMRRAMAQWKKAWLEIKGLPILAQKGPLCCLLEQDTLSSVQYLFNAVTVHDTWLKNVDLDIDDQV